MSEVKPWTAEDFARWYSKHPVIPSRDYVKTIVPRITALKEDGGFTVEKYGEATYSTQNPGTGVVDLVTHDLYVILAGDFDPAKETYVILGGTHGYEKGGTLAALGFAEDEADIYSEDCNFIIYPCVCPGPYEKELRGTEGRIDPNRDAFLDGAKSEEMQALARSLKDLHARLYGGDLTRKFTAAVDLHETPQKDIVINEENAAAAGELFDLDVFPDGLFLIAFDKDRHYAERIIAHVKSEGHKIVDDEAIYGSPNRGGMILASEMKPPVGSRVRQLTAHFAHANFTTEYCGLSIHDGMPDAERAEPQRAVIRGMLRYGPLTAT